MSNKMSNDSMSNNWTFKPLDFICHLALACTPMPLAASFCLACGLAGYGSHVLKWCMAGGDFNIVIKFTIPRLLFTNSINYIPHSIPPKPSPCKVSAEFWLDFLFWDIIIAFEPMFSRFFSQFGFCFTINIV